MCTYFLKKKLCAHICICARIEGAYQLGIALQFKVLPRFFDPVLKLFQKRVALFILAARRHDLWTGITSLGCKWG